MTNQRHATLSDPFERVKCSPARIPSLPVLRDKYREIYVPWISNYPSPPAGLSVISLILDAFATPTETSQFLQKELTTSPVKAGLLCPAHTGQNFVLNDCYSTLSPYPIKQYFAPIANNLRFQKELIGKIIHPASSQYPLKQNWWALKSNTPCFDIWKQVGEF